MTKLVAFMRDESGASAAEYVLILAVVGSAVALAAATLGTAIGDAMNLVSSFLGTITFS
jgi:pilus assembly protein Flp/PilA